MTLFATNSITDESISIEIIDEQDVYSPGDRVRGNVLVSNKYWRQMNIEVLLISEEHAELDPSQCGKSDFENRRLTISGESVDGEVKEVDGTLFGVFPFQLRIIEDSNDPYLLPSFELDCDNLVNAVRWLVEVRATFKHKTIISRHEIAVITSHPIPVSNQQKCIKKELHMRICDFNAAFQRRRGPSWHSKISSMQHQLSNIFFDTSSNIADIKLTGILQLPDYPLQQYPHVIPLKLIILTSKPHLVVISEITVELITEIRVKIHDKVSDFAVAQGMIMQNHSKIFLSNEVTDLSQLFISCIIQNVCPGFRGRWLEVRHRLNVSVTFEAFNNSENKEFLLISNYVEIISPKTLSFDAPPMYTPPGVSMTTLDNRPSPSTDRDQDWDRSRLTCTG